MPDEVLTGEHIRACPRIAVRKVRGVLPAHFIEQLEQNQLIASCCRHPENHDIEAFYSCKDVADEGKPDVYIMYCTCGRRHVRLCVGGDESPPMPHETVEAYAARLAKGKRPFWESR